MKTVVLRAGIMEAISTVGRAAGGDSLPALKHILIEAQNNKLVFKGTNLEIAIQHSVSAKVLEGGKVTVPARAFAEVLAALRSERINLEQKGDNLSLTSDNYRATFQGLPAEDFPLIPKIKNNSTCIECKAGSLRDALGAVLIATEFSDLRPELNSVLFHFSQERIVLAATDSFRLAEQQIPPSQFSASGVGEFRALIPLKTSQELLRLLGEQETVKVCADENQILVAAGAAECISRLIDGIFPEYSAIVPTSFKSELVVGREDLVEAIKLAGVFNDRNSEVRFAYMRERKALEVSAAAQGVGENVYVLPAAIKGEDGDILFNGRYVSDMLRVGRGSEIFLGLNDEAAPALLRSQGDASYYYIVKPILKT
ncbi:MAG: DNA polymerase III subunit beta [Candidatus Liptonbacteria bacterium]|nr:DNA polymerase III subunit beta [Candidatus Liptonbacteria bacterium]